MSCVLRAEGVHFQPEEFLNSSELIASRVWRIGDPVPKGFSKPIRHATEAGFVIVVSDAGLDMFARQVEDAVDFLTAHRVPIRKLVSFPGVEGVEIDFGIELRPTATHNDHLPPRLVTVAGELGLGISLSHYTVHNQT